MVLNVARLNEPNDDVIAFMRFDSGFASKVMVRSVRGR